MAARMRLSILVLALALPAALSGCGASIGNITTGSLFGGNDKPPPPPQIKNDPISRAMQVGATAARAEKCGFNFDPVRLRTQYLAAEAGGLGTAQDVAKVEKIYDVTYRSVSKAIAAKGESYCSAQKTARIKLALNRHLTGDYTPEPPEQKDDDDGSLFSGLGSSSGDGYKDSNPWRHDE